MRNTKQKKLIKEVLANGEHLSAEEIYKLVRERSSIDLSTVYRNLNVMVCNKEIEKIIDTAGTARYHSISSHHGHLICLQCNNIFEIPCKICSQMDTISEDMSFDHVDHVITIYGYCQDCKGGKRY